MNYDSIVMILLINYVLKDVGLVAEKKIVSVNNLFQSYRLMSAISGSSESKENVKKKHDDGQKYLGSLLSAVQNCQVRYGGKAELATEDDVRVADLCEQWFLVLSHGIRPQQRSSNASLHTLVSAGINYALNVDFMGTSLWNYSRLHLTKHEEERFNFLKTIKTPLGHFKAFLRAALNERSLERYLHSWVGHHLLTEYYEDWALMRDTEATSLLPNMAAGLVSILFALSIDKPELNESTIPPGQSALNSEPLVPLEAPVLKVNTKKKPIRQVISFDSPEETMLKNSMVKPAPNQIVNSKSLANSADWNSAPPTCINSPDPRPPQGYGVATSHSEPTTSKYDGKKSIFFPEETAAPSERISNESPAQILSRLSEKAREIFSGRKTSSSDTVSQKDSDVSSGDRGNERLSESESEEGPAEGSVSCLELCFPDHDNLEYGEGHLKSLLAKQQEENFGLQLQISQLDISHKEKVNKMERTIADLNRENDRLKEQLRNYVSAVQMLKQDGPQSDEVKHYEAKLVQVAEMHAELMEFNDMLQRRLMTGNAMDGSIVEYVAGEASVRIWIPSAFLISGSKSFHVYQILIKVRSEEWSVYRRYSEFRKLYSDLKNTHPDIGPFKFPPKKAIGKKEAWLVERRRGRLEAWLRHVSLALPQLRKATSRSHLISLLPFFGNQEDTPNSTGTPRTP